MLIVASDEALTSPSLAELQLLTQQRRKTLFERSNSPVFVYLLGENEKEMLPHQLWSI